MITDADIKKLKTIFATKKDLERFATKKDLEKFATKKDLERFATKKGLDKLGLVSATKKDLEKFLSRDEFITKFDALMYELKAIREEFVVGSYRRRENTDAIENHERRLAKLEKLRIQSVNN